MHAQSNISLKAFNTFGIDATANQFIEVDTTEEVIDLFNREYFNNPFLILGGGSNILFKGNFPGLVIKNNIKGIEEKALSDERVMIKAGAGVEWHDLVTYCIERNYGGIENLSLIPGSVGAAPIQNIGAYGVELKDCFESLEAVDLTNGQLIHFKKDDCHFRYRDSVFKKEWKGRLCIVSVSLTLVIDGKPDTSYGAIRDELKLMGVNQEPDIREVGLAVSAIRERKLPDPELLGNAGSFFKNPLVSKAHFDRLINKYGEIPNYAAPGGKVKLPAGWLIEQCGWKGKRLGNVGVHEKQALVLVNYGNSSGEEVLELAEKIKTTVLDRFKVELEMEVNVAG